MGIAHSVVEHVVVVFGERARRVVRYAERRQHQG